MSGFSEKKILVIFLTVAWWQKKLSGEKKERGMNQNIFIFSLKVYDKIKLLKY